jgi:hypothetical protein
MWDFLDIDWSFDATPAPVAPAPVVAQPAPQPIVAQPAPAPVVQPAPQPIVAQPAPAPVMQPAPQPAPVIAQPAPQPVIQAPPEPVMGMNALQQTQNLNMVNVPAAATPPPVVQTQPRPQPAPVASRPIPQVSMPMLSPQEQALFNRNIPATGPARMPAQPTRPAQPANRSTALAAVYRPPPVQAYVPPPNALTAERLFPTPRTTTTARPNTLQPRQATAKEITIQKPTVSREDTYKGPVAKQLGRLTTPQAQRMIR